jgi:hypothetical protein
MSVIAVNLTASFRVPQAVGSSLSPLGGDEMVEVSSTEFIEVVSPLPPPATPTTDDDVDLQPPPNYTQVRSS